MSGRFQLETIRQEMPPHDIAIALVHHPGNWLVPEENPVFFRDLERDFSFVLHGHEHRDFVRQNASTGHAVISAGACHEWSTGKNNGYNIVRLDLAAARGEVWLREYEATGGGWRPRVISGRTGDDGVWQLHLERLLEDISRPMVHSSRTKTTTEREVVSTLAGDTSLSSQIDYEARYRKAVVDRLDHMHLFGIDVPRDSREYSLSVAFVSVSLADELAEEDEDSSCEAEGATSDNDSAITVAETSLPAESFFAKLNGASRRLLIRGAAGCGKTTLLRWAAVQAGKNHGTGEDGWPQRVPFIIRLRDFPSGDLPPPKDYVLLLAKELPDSPRNWVTQLLDNGRALIMFDGVDEVPALRREQVVADIRQLIETYPTNAYIVTTRPEAVERGFFESLGFLSARVEPLTPGCRNELVDRWHSAMEVRLRQRNEAADLRPLRERLKRRLDENPAIARLTINPLLCAVVCALHREREENLPETPVGLCDKLTEMLLDRRDRERPGIDAERAEDNQYRRLAYSRRRGLVGRLAHHMVLSGESAVAEADAIEQIREGLKSYQLGELSPERILQLLIERSGLLQESSEQRIEFLHNTLKEYLAAERFVNSDDIESLAEHCEDETWQPVILFALALPRDGSQFATRLVRAIRNRTEMTSEVSGRSRREKAKAAAVRAQQFFFFRCCATAHQIDDAEVQLQFDQLAETLLPPRTLSDAEALAACGEATIPHLRLRPYFTAAQRAACVRALRVIGGPRAARALEPYLEDPMQTVQKETAYVVDPLRLPGVLGWFKDYGCWPHWIPTQRRTNVNGLVGLTTRQTLHLSCSPVSDISPLARLVRLESLELDHTKVCDLSPLAELTSLQMLRLSFTPVSDLAPLAGLTQLQRLNLDFTNVGDISALAGLAALRELDLTATRVADISALANLTGLQKLHLGYTPVTDFSALRGLMGLQELILTFTRLIDASPLAGLTGLRKLDLSRRPVADLSPLRGLAALEELNLRETQVTDLSALADLARLREVDLTSTRVTDISPLAGLTGLRKLDLSRTCVADLSPLAGLAALEELNLRETQVTDLSALAALTSLRQLDLCFMPASDLSALSGLCQLRFLNLLGTKVRDMSVLKPVLERGLVINRSMHN